MFKKVIIAEDLDSYQFRNRTNLKRFRYCQIFNIQNIAMMLF